MNEENLITYYNKFNEGKRLNSRHGQVEFITVMKYIKMYLKEIDNPKIIDIGAGMGKYSIELANENYDVTAVELVKHNLREIEKCKKVKAFQGNAVDLSKFQDNYFDLVLLFGPLYHLIEEDRIKALNEAKRIAKKDGIIMCQYIMNEYCVITHGFKEKKIKESIKDKKLDNTYHVLSSEKDLYSTVRIEDINKLNKEAGLKRIKILTPDGPANYIRTILNKLTEEEFNEFIKYHLSICERYEILGASAHVLDILKKN